MARPMLSSVVRLFVLAVISSLLNGCMLMHTRDHGERRGGLPQRAVCPVCRTQLKISERSPRATHGGQLYFFASEDHLREFIKDPSRFALRPAGDAASDAAHEGHGGKR